MLFPRLYSLAGPKEAKLNKVQEFLGEEEGGTLLYEIL